MKILSIDVETTGLDLENCSLLEFGAIIEDTCDVKPLDELPSFSYIIDTGKNFTGSAYALNMNANIISILAGQENLNKEELEEYRRVNKIISIEDLANHFYYFLQVNNFIEKKETGFSKMITKWKDFDNKEHLVDLFTNKSSMIHLNVLGKNFATFDRIFIERIPRWKQIFKIRRRIADPAILLTDWKNDDFLPNFQTCMERTGLKGLVSHTAYEDAKDTLLMLRKATNNYEYKAY